MEEGISFSIFYCSLSLFADLISFSNNIVSLFQSNILLIKTLARFDYMLSIDHNFEEA